tara:strand:- start:1377 stop:5558 length:4182 start_codon:yes stop_codon:yes gene_type:complete
MRRPMILSLLWIIAICSVCSAQVTIDNYSVNSTGQVQLSIQAQANKYYTLTAQHSPTFQWITSMTMGVNGTMVISEPAAAYPESNYTITEHNIANPDDSDGDGMDDITEFNNMPTDAPLNFASPIALIDGATSIPDAQTFTDLATVQNVGWAPFLDDQLYVKFGILNRDSPNPQVYFINSNTYIIHASFWSGIGASVTGDDSSGEIVFNPNVITPGGVIGTYSFNFSFGDAKDFEATQRTYELLVANMPFLQNNMNHFIGQNDENNYLNNYAQDFVGSRIDVVLESEVFAEVNYIPFHEAEGYGFFKQMALDESPGSRDIVLYDALPNSLPRVGGIITSVIQTPLSHVNLRAIQDNVPNAYIKDPLSIDSIGNLLNGYIYYKVESDKFYIREATLSEVNTWYEELRPTEEQIPIRDLSQTTILALDSIEFEMATSFGAKCSNVATMRSFGFPTGTIPDGFGIPFYFYDEFMKFNNFYEEAEVMINNPAFINDLNFRIDRLKDFRKDIKDAPMPQWMLDELQAMHDDFPVGTAVRCRSSTNNEDLPGFSGAGLYTSKTQYLDEGHISKSIKQVYASMWNFRAFEERDFYRVDHFIAAMGVLCHPNFQEEKSNGVGISIDPIYETDSTFYLNTQLGESLITNPEANSIPEEILLYEDALQGAGYLVLRLSNLVNAGELVMDQAYLNQMRDFLTVIHDEFATLYDVEGAEGFAMDIEYKVTAQDQLIIKQARPWVSFWADIKANNDLGITAFVNPQSSSSLGNSEIVTTNIANKGLFDMSDFEISLLVDGQLAETLSIPDTIEPFSNADFQFAVAQDFSVVGDYNLTGIVKDVDDEYGNNDTLNVVLTKLHLLDGSLDIMEVEAICDDKIRADIMVTNHGETTINELEIELTINGVSIDIFSFNVDISSQEQDIISLIFDDILSTGSSNILNFDLINANSQIDGDLVNNSAFTSTVVDSDYDIVTLLIDADNYPQETSWKIYDEVANEIVASGSLQSGTNIFTEDICLNYSSCFSLYVYDSFGDGICCGFGRGDITVFNAAGEIIAYDDGEFDDKTVQLFCPDGTGCVLTADVNISHSSSSTAGDGVINISTTSGLSPFQYSIDGGQTFSKENTFSNLESGNYSIVIQGAAGNCSYQEDVVIETCLFNTVDISATKVTSVVIANGTITITPYSGVAPHQYSIDGGQNFTFDNVFTDLAVGNYNVIVKDAAEICMYEQQVPVKACKDFNLDITITNASSQLANDGSISLYPTSGSSPFSYSVDGGITFFTSNEFNDLDTGTYEIVIVDASGVCTQERTLTIEAPLVSGINDLFSGDIRIYPNPTKDNFSVEIESSVGLLENVSIEVYDNLGRRIKTATILKNSNLKTIISLEGFASGSYFIRCYNNRFENRFKLLKF